MPVVDRENRPIGVLRLHDALAVMGADSLATIDALCQERSLDGLREVKAVQVDLAEQLLSDSLPAPAIQQVLSDVNRDIHGRIIENQVAAMAREGWGPPPVAFCLIIMGSGGRGESFLYPDQDNGLILDDYPDEEHGPYRSLLHRAERGASTAISTASAFPTATAMSWRAIRCGEKPAANGVPRSRSGAVGARPSRSN